MSFNSLTERSGVITPLTSKIEQVKPLIKSTKAMNIYPNPTPLGNTSSLDVNLQIRSVHNKVNRQS